MLLNFIFKFCIDPGKKKCNCPRGALCKCVQFEPKPDPFPVKEPVVTPIIIDDPVPMLYWQ